MGENELDRVEGQIEGINFATEILKQLKETTHKLWVTIWVLIGVLAATVAGFIWYLNQYDYVSSYEYTATGVNAIIDNDGNIIAKDVSDDKLIEILELLNNGGGESEDNEGTG